MPWEPRHAYVTRDCTSSRLRGNTKFWIQADLLNQFQPAGGNVRCQGIQPPRWGKVVYSVTSEAPASKKKPTRAPFEYGHLGGQLFNGFHGGVKIFLTRFNNIIGLFNNIVKLKSFGMVKLCLLKNRIKDLGCTTNQVGQFLFLTLNCFKALRDVILFCSVEILGDIKSLTKDFKESNGTCKGPKT